MSTIRVVNLQHPDSVEPNVVLKTDGTAVFASGITISGSTNLTVSGTAEFASGTAANPEITFIDDNDTGIYSPAANEVAITTSGTQRLIVDDTGKVGISTSGPFTTLHVNNDGSGTTVANSGTTDATTATRIGRQSVGIDIGILNNGTSYLQNRNVGNFATNYSFAINPNGGYIGIGTASPAKDLDVNGEIRASTGILFDTDTTAANTLDDYEEGTWTPGLFTATAYQTAVGYYTKVGRLVTWTLRLQVNTVASSSTGVEITGFPFVNDSLVAGPYGGGFRSFGRFYEEGTIINPNWHMPVNATSLRLYDKTTFVPLNNSGMFPTDNFIMHGFYYTDT